MLFYLVNYMYNFGYITVWLLFGYIRLHLFFRFNYIFVTQIKILINFVNSCSLILVLDL